MPVVNRPNALVPISPMERAIQQGIEDETVFRALDVMAAGGEKEFEAQRLGELNLELSALIQKYGIKSVQWMLGVIVEDLSEASIEHVEFVSATLTVLGPQKINVIKELRLAMGIGLRDAKDLSEALPRLILASIPKNEGVALAARFSALGATVRLDPCEPAKGV